MSVETANGTGPDAGLQALEVAPSRLPWRTPRVILASDASLAEATTNISDDGPSEVS